MPLGLVPLRSQVITMVCFLIQIWRNTPVCRHAAIAPSDRVSIRSDRKAEPNIMR